MRYGMVIDLERCIGCQACTVACKEENRTAPGVFWNRLYDVETGIYPSVRRIFLPRPCMHCADAPCLDVCPTGATYRRDDGLVLVDAEKCVGCKACVAACPYGARYFYEDGEGYFPKGTYPEPQLPHQVHHSGVVEKCTYCTHRLDEGLEPACIVACPTKARIFGDLDDPQDEVVMLIRERGSFQVFPEMGTDPSTWYLSRR
ncbi:MAG: 4Fe-4S dicluster domain-containing protein [Chloroflexota bacterium]|nr:4Fe-4S dicluster domain-containing protein [Chloroflexota bacterium]